MSSSVNTIMCLQPIFLKKIYKMQTKSENFEIRHDVMISFMEAMVKIWENFEHFSTYDVYTVTID
jgi:hypothetical protein